MRLLCSRHIAARSLCALVVRSRRTEGFPQRTWTGHGQMTRENICSSCAAATLSAAPWDGATHGSAATPDSE